ncbi:MAG: methyltransferase [Candidatus Bathyarchaeota archaeon]|nr:methyltransferase [Candidatus Bathyarchaeota archaeon]
MNKENQNSEHYFSSNPKSRYIISLISVVLKDREFEFLTSSSVFSKKRIDTGTRLLIESMVLPEKGVVLDLGCGYGAIGIVAASTNPKLKVILTDVNSRAVDLAKLNLKKNRIKNAQVREGYLYEPVRDKIFNCILLNPPVSAGMSIVKTMILEAPKIMANKCSFQMVIRSKIGGKILPQTFVEAFGNCTIISRSSGYRVLKGEKR